MASKKALQLENAISISVSPCPISLYAERGAKAKVSVKVQRKDGERVNKSSVLNSYLAGLFEASVFIRNFRHLLLGPLFRQDFRLNLFIVIILYSFYEGSPYANFSFPLVGPPRTLRGGEVQGENYLNFCSINPILFFFIFLCPRPVGRALIKDQSPANFGRSPKHVCLQTGSEGKTKKGDSYPGNETELCFRRNKRSSVVSRFR